MFIVLNAMIIRAFIQERAERGKKLKNVAKMEMDLGFIIENMNVRTAD